MKLLRYLVIFINVLAAVALVAIGVGAWALGSERGSAWLVSRLAAFAAPELRIGEVSGTLLDEISLGRVRYRVPGTEVQVERLRAALDLSALLTGTLRIRDLALSEVAYRPLDEPAAADAAPATGAPAAVFRSPLAVVIESGTVAGIVVYRNPESIRLGQLTLTARLEGSELAVDRLETRYEMLDLSAQGSVELSPSGRVAATLSASGELDGTPVLGSLTLSGRLPRLEVVPELIEPFAVTGTGTVELGSPPRGELDLRWQDFVAPGLPNLRSSGGNVALAGTLDSLQFDGAGSLAFDTLAADFSARGSVDGPRIAIDELVLNDGDARVEASGMADLGSRDWSASLSARGVDPAVLAPGWPGAVDADASLAGRLEAPFALTAERLELSGELRGYAFEAEAAGAYRGLEDIDVETLDVALGANHAHVDGRVAEQLDLNVDADLERLEAIVPGLTGTAAVRIAVTGPSDDAVADGRIELADIRYAGYGADHAAVSGRVSLTSDGPLALALEADALALGQLPAPSIVGRVDGTVAAHRLSLESASEQWSLAVTATGGIADGEWRGQLADFALEQPQLGAWSLETPAALELGPGGLDLGQSCLVQAATTVLDMGRVCGGVVYGGGPDDYVWVNATDFDIARLNPLLPEEVTLSGIYQLDAEIDDFTSFATGALTVTGGTTEIAVDLGNEERAATTIDGLTLEAQLEGLALAAELSLTGRDTGTISLGLASADISDMDAQVAGRLEANWPDLSALSLLSPDVGSVGGTVTASMQLEGTAANPSIGGSAEWRDGTVEVPAWGVMVEDIDAMAESPDGTELDFSGTAAIAGSQLMLSGVTELDAERSWPTRFRLSGDAIQLVQRADMAVTVSPELEIDVALPRIEVTGTVLVPAADISLDRLPNQATQPSPDVVVHGADAPESIRPLAVQAAIEIMLGDNVRLRDASLDSRVAGELALDYTSGAAPVAMGTLGLTGTYTAFGQTLDLARGQLLFNGPLDDPGLDVRAQRTVPRTLIGQEENVVVGVQQTGTLKNPVTRIFSEPAMSEADALSYLLFNRPLSSSSEEENATLQSAALTLGLQQALPVVQRIGDSLGLDELSVQTTALDAGALMAGKYLSPKLYVRYSYGLFNHIGGLLLRYRINDRFSIETRSGDQKSMDLIYSVEKD